MKRIRAVAVSVVVGGTLAGALLGAPAPAGAQGAKDAVVVGSIQQSDVPAVNKQNRAGLKAGVLAAKRAGVNIKVKVCDEGADPNSAPNVPVTSRRTPMWWHSSGPPATSVRRSIP